MIRKQTLGLAFIATLALVFLTARGLRNQGAYYDELHQAPAAFRYIGSNPMMFTWAYHGIPVLNMTYSGAIKSAVYGTLLRYFFHHFDIVSWRLLGIFFVAAGLATFYWIAGKWLPLETAILFALFLLTDITVILTTRHDWGPTALALGLRLTLLAIWISVREDNCRPYKVGVFGFIVGLSIFEKLSSVVLLAPLLIQLGTVRVRGVRSWMAAALGLMVGTFPLFVANVATYRLGQGFISLADTASDKDPFAPKGLIDYAYNYLAVGQGQMARHQILAEQTSSLFTKSEAALMVGMLLLIIVQAFRRRRTDRSLGFAAVLAITYLTIAAALFALPRATSVHHWIIGTPFQYAAVAIALAALDRRSLAYKVFCGATVCLLLLRIPTLLAVERSLTGGTPSLGFDPAFNRISAFAARHANDAIFVSSDWGSGTQLYCGSNGTDNFVFEPFWGEDPSQRALNVAAASTKKALYVVTTGISPQFSAASDAVVQAMMTAPDWKLEAMDEAIDFGRIQIRKFVRKASGRMQ